MAAFSMEPPGSEPMALGSPTSPKVGPSTQFLPGFLMGDLPMPSTPQPRPSLGVMELRTPILSGGSPPQSVVSTHKDKTGAPPVRSLYDDLSSPAGLVATPLNTKKPVSFSMMQSSGLPSTPGAASSVFSPAAGQSRKSALSPAQMDPFYTQGDTLTSDDRLDDTWVTVFGFPQASASYILLQFAQYGIIIKHVMSNTGNWMHIQYQSKLQARKALSKDGRIFGECIMIGVKPCIDKSVMESGEKSRVASVSSVYTPPFKTFGTPGQHVGTPRATTTMRPLTPAFNTYTSDYQVVSDKPTPRKDDSLVSKAMEYILGCCYRLSSALSFIAPTGSWEGLESQELDCMKDAQTHLAVTSQPF
uniref:Nucleoporin NUP35 n=1 Tax=Leptobrachium leishanense TaxID=445787 RepID=A0A8C5QX01_9ANUR